MVGGAKESRINTVDRQDCLGRKPGLVESLIIQYSEIVPEPNNGCPFATPLRVRQVPMKCLVSKTVHVASILLWNLVDW